MEIIKAHQQTNVPGETLKGFFPCSSLPLTISVKWIKLRSLKGCSPKVPRSGSELENYHATENGSQTRTVCTKVFVLFWFGLFVLKV